MDSVRLGCVLSSPSQGIGARLAKYRRIAGFSAQTLSRVTGGKISRGTIARIETGERKDVTIDEVVTLSLALGISPIALILPLETPYEDVTLGEGQWASVIGLANWFQGNYFELNSYIDLEGDYENIYGTPATLASETILQGIMEFDSTLKDDSLETKMARERLRAKLSMLGVDLSLFDS